MDKNQTSVRKSLTFNDYTYFLDELETYNVMTSSFEGK